MPGRDYLAGDVEDPTFFGAPQEADPLPQPFRRIGAGGLGAACGALGLAS